MPYTWCMTSNCALAEQCACFDDDAGKHRLTRTHPGTLAT